MMPTYYEEDATANLSWLSWLLCDMQNPDETRLGLFQKCSQLTSFQGANQRGWHFNKFFKNMSQKAGLGSFITSLGFKTGAYKNPVSMCCGPVEFIGMVETNKNDFHMLRV